VYTDNYQVNQVKYYADKEDEEAKRDSSITQNYDPLGRIKSEIREIAGNSYTTSYRYNKYGNLAAIKYPKSSEYLEYGYDDFNQLKWIEGIAGSETNPAFQYNNNSQITKISYDNGVETSFAYNQNSRSDRITTVNLETGQELLGVDYEYDANVITKRTLEIYYSSDNSSYIELSPDKWKYQRDYQGNITLTIPDGISAQYIKVHSKFDDRDAQFDSVDKGEFTNVLKEAIKVYRRETEATLTYKYDSVGNRLQKKQITGTVERTDYTYDQDTNQLLTNGEYAYQYDRAGNMVAKGNKYKIEDGEVEFAKKQGKGVRYWEYKYNLQGRLTEVYKNVDPDDKEDAIPIAEFIYDASGQRIRTIRYDKSDNVEKKVDYVYSYQGQVLVEKNTEDKYTSYIYVFEKKFAKLEGTVDDYFAEDIDIEINYFHHDNLGSTRAMTDDDGKVVMEQDYLPFGGDLAKPGQLKVKNETGESYKYTGQKQVASIGLYYYNARYYDPSIGRFNRQDSYKGELSTPQTQHLYVYVLNNPLKYNDPTGNKWYNPLSWGKSDDSSKSHAQGVSSSINSDYVRNMLKDNNLNVNSKRSKLDRMKQFCGGLIQTVGGGVEYSLGNTITGASVASLVGSGSLSTPVAGLGVAGGVAISADGVANMAEGVGNMYGALFDKDFNANKLNFVNRGVKKAGGKIGYELGGKSGRRRGREIGDITYTVANTAVNLGGTIKSVRGIQKATKTTKTIVGVGPAVKVEQTVAHSKRIGGHISGLISDIFNYGTLGNDQDKKTSEGE
jgi:RHS repeat-associated protein